MDLNGRREGKDAFARTPTVKKLTPYRKTRESILQLSGIRDKISKWNLENDGAAVNRAAVTPVRPRSVHRTRAPNSGTVSSLNELHPRPTSVVFNVGQDQRAVVQKHHESSPLPLPGPKPALSHNINTSAYTNISTSTNTNEQALHASRSRRASVSLSMSDLLTKDLAALRNAVKGLKNLTMPHSSNAVSQLTQNVTSCNAIPEQYERDGDNDVVMGEASPSPAPSPSIPPPRASGSQQTEMEMETETARARNATHASASSSSTISSTNNPLFDEDDDATKRTTPQSVTGRTFRRLSDLRLESAKGLPKEGTGISAMNVTPEATPLNRPLLRQSFISNEIEKSLQSTDSAAKRGIALASKLHAAARDLLATSTTPSSRQKAIPASPSPMVFPQFSSAASPLLIDNQRNNNKEQEALQDQSRLRKLNNQYEELKATSDAAAKQRDEALTLLQTYKETLANLQDAHSRELIGVKGEAVVLQNDLEDVRKRFETLYRDKYLPLKRHVEVLSQENNELRTRLNQVEAEKTKIEEAAALRCTLKDKERDERYRALAKTLEATMQRAKVTSESKERLAKEVVKKDNEILALEERVNDLLRSLNETRTENETLITTRRRNQGRIETLEAELAEKSAEVESMSLSLTAMCDDLLDASTLL